MVGLLLVILASFAAESACAATAPLPRGELDSMLQSGKIDTKSLLQATSPFHQRHLRRLQDDNDKAEGENNDQENEAQQQDGAEQEEGNQDQGDVNNEAEQDGYAYLQYDDEYFIQYGALGERGITGDHSVIFNSCVSLSVQEDWETLENFDSNMKYIIEKGQLRSVQNFVLFNVCKTLDDCSTGKPSLENTYMVDLNTWVVAMIEYLPDEKDLYCQGCWNQYEYCAAYLSTGADSDESTAFFYDDIKFEVVDCKQCEKYGCYNEDGDVYEQNDWDGVAQWIASLAQCQATGEQWGGLDLSTGFMCNEYGDGLEIATFLDQECTLYNTQKAYRNVLNTTSEEYTYYYKSKAVMKFIFDSMFDCYGGEVLFINSNQTDLIGSNVAYDPCAINYENASQVYDQYACEDLVNSIPCYVYYDADGNKNEIDQEECAAFMEVYPCWTMPGGQVAANYTEACEYYQMTEAHEVSAACMELFTAYSLEDYNGGEDQQQYNQGQNYQQDVDLQNQFIATALSACQYNYENGIDGNNAGGQDGADGYVTGNWSTELSYDIAYDIADNPTAICTEMSYLFGNKTHLATQVYDKSVSGQMYQYSSASSGSGGSSSSSSSSGSGGTASGDVHGDVYDDGSGSNLVDYFPTINTKGAAGSFAKKYRRMSKAEIAYTTIGVTAAVFVLTYLACELCRKKRNQDEVTQEYEQRKEPLMLS